MHLARKGTVLTRPRLFNKRISRRARIIGPLDLRPVDKVSKLVASGSTSPNRSALAQQLLLRRRVSDVVPVDVLAVAVDPRCDDAEAIECGTFGLGILRKFETGRLAIERHGDPRLAARRGRLVVKSPLVG